MPSPSASPAARLSRPRMHNPVVATVLVVDDDPIVLDVVVRYLERDGFRTLTAADGEAARTVLERESPSLVVLDVMLPGMDGLSLCRWIRATSDLPVILLTVKEFDLLWFLASNPNHVFSRDQLMDRIWGYAAAFDTGTVTVHIRRLREKIEHDPSQPQLLETVWGVGYRLRA